jgi:hypothetical protein
MMKLIALGIVLALFIVACSSEQPPLNQETTLDTPIVKETQTVNQDAPKETVADGVAEKFKSLLNQKRSVSWKINYDMNTKAQGYATSGKMTQYFKGDDFRTDFTTQGVESRSYFKDDVFTTCTKMGGSWNCFKSEPQKEMTPENIEEALVRDDSDYVITADGTKIIAGVTTDCYKVISAKDEVTARYCLASDGAPLHITTQAPEVTAELTATSYSKTVTDADFVPPAAAKDVGSMTAPAGGSSDDPCAACEQIPEQYRSQCLAAC